MSTSTVTPLSPQQRTREDIIREWFVVSDTQAFDRFGEFLAEDIEFVFGNAAPLNGLSTVISIGEQMKSALKSVSHELRYLRHGIDGSITAELWVLYTRLDDRELRLPAGVVFVFDVDDKIVEYRIYVDQADLYA